MYPVEFFYALSAYFLILINSKRFLGIPTLEITFTGVSIVLYKLNFGIPLEWVACIVLGLFSPRILFSPNSFMKKALNVFLIFILIILVLLIKEEVLISDIHFAAMGCLGFLVSRKNMDKGLLVCLIFALLEHKELHLGAIFFIGFFSLSILLKEVKKVVYYKFKKNIDTLIQTFLLFSFPYVFLGWSYIEILCYFLLVLNLSKSFLINRYRDVSSMESL